MTHLDTQIQTLKEETKEMFLLVISQMTKAKEALINFDKDMALNIDINFYYFYIFKFTSRNLKINT